ncbi:hypothetical protein A1507_11695 [Methylomonas koyamae]|uniref:Uncharacterized protein n=1 Tax=Methylomonas koyamae TaxID=702114 RepID=A0A177NHR4_9GAMM|nr:hypothetical protein [Methylomonas koyamae]OAI16600.1 hypothetical protein A1507_11695 [Methylomonas koyamae]
MQNDIYQDDPCAASKHEFSRAVDEIKAGILAAGNPKPIGDSSARPGAEICHQLANINHI